MRDDDAQSLHAKRESREALNQLGREQPDRLSLVGVPRGGSVGLVPLVELIIQRRGSHLIEWVEISWGVRACCCLRHETFGDENLPKTGNGTSRDTCTRSWTLHIGFIQ